MAIKRLAYVFPDGIEGMEKRSNQNDRNNSYL